MYRSLLCGVGVISVVALVLYAGWYEPVVEGQFLEFTDTPYIVPHSGYGEYAPMSSLYATERALSEGYRFIDLDVRLTKDQQLVVFHDPTLSKTSQKVGLISDSNLAELRTYSITSPSEYSGPAQSIAPLKSHLELIANSESNAYIIVEVKDWSVEFAEMSEDLLLDELRAYNLLSRAILVTAHPFRVCSLNKKAPEALSMLTFVDNNFPLKNSHFYTLPWFVRVESTRKIVRKWCRPDALAINYLVAPGTISGLRDAGYPIFLWSINTLETFNSAYSYGVFAIVSDKFKLVQ